MPFINSESYHFLTTKPVVRRLHTLQMEWLYIEPLVDGVPSTLNVLITYTDLSTQAANIDLTIAAVALRKNEVRMVDMSYAAQNYTVHQPAKTIQKIEVWIEIPLETNDKITYLPWSQATDNMKQFFYANSLGGIDSFVAVGDGQSGYQYTGEVATRQVDDGYLTETGQDVAVNNRVRQVFTAHSGHKPKLEIAALADMLHTKFIRKLEYFGATPKFVPVISAMQGVTLPADLANLNHFDFQYKYGWEDRALDRAR